MNRITTNITSHKSECAASFVILAVLDAQCWL